MRVAAILGCCLLCACTSAQEALKSVESSYIGQKADRFFIARGPPAGTHRLSDGGTIYTWIGGVKGYHIPSTTTVNLTPTFGGGATGTATTYGGGNLAIGCKLELLADPQDVVRSIRVAQDTIGAWQLSRCAEILKS
jgi:hypothetical protein